MENTVACRKPNVLNPLTFFNTVGTELDGIFRAHGIEDGSRRMGVRNLPGKEMLSERLIDKACAILGQDDTLRNFLRDFQSDYMREKERCRVAYARSKKNFTRLKNILFLLKGEYNAGMDVMDDILDFFGVDSEDEIFSESDKIAALFRKQNAVAVNPVNLKAWQRRCELEFAKQNLPDYDEQALLAWINGRTWDNNIENTEYFRQLPAILAPFGVSVLLVPYAPKTVYGAVRWMDGHPLVQISDRNQDLATCWVTLFHELGHVIRHRDKYILDGTQNEHRGQQNKIEAEANDFANYYLFNGDELRKKIFYNVVSQRPMNADALARKYNVHPLFASYWLIKAQYHPTVQFRRHIDFGRDYRQEPV